MNINHIVQNLLELLYDYVQVDLMKLLEFFIKITK